MNQYQDGAEVIISQNTSPSESSSSEATAEEARVSKEPVHERHLNFYQYVVATSSTFKQAVRLLLTPIVFLFSIFNRFSDWAAAELSGSAPAHVKLMKVENPRILARKGQQCGNEFSPSRKTRRPLVILDLDLTLIQTKWNTTECQRKSSNFLESKSCKYFSLDFHLY